MGADTFIGIEILNKLWAGSIPLQQYAFGIFIFFIAGAGLSYFLESLIPFMVCFVLFMLSLLPMLQHAFDET